MKLLIVRHGEPDYERDSLTQKGFREAEILSERLCHMKIDAFYVSPLGRAKDTAWPTLDKMGRSALECEWLREFAPLIERPDAAGRKCISWDWLPQDWMAEECFFDRDRWYEQKNIADSDVKKEYEWVVRSFDELLAEHGYERDGNGYKAVRPNNGTICLFCHFGLQCVLLSHLLNVSPMIVWHGFCAAPASVTTIVTEERRKGIASFRISSFGDISHLYAGGEEPAFAARFCECYDNKEERHD
ncbi:MAG: histidine phosphatase family protein [Lachnospiraceae bacterium]|nr:histidine phosphatase family protein [Lachnospiraceae bacterium]